MKTIWLGSTIFIQGSLFKSFQSFLHRISHKFIIDDSSIIEDIPKPLPSNSPYFPVLLLIVHIVAEWELCSIIKT